MKALPECYGTMLPDLSHLEPNKPLEGLAFSAMVTSHGLGAPSHKVEIKRDGCEKCAACPAYRTCYDCCMARLLMNTVLKNRWYGN